MLFNQNSTFVIACIALFAVVFAGCATIFKGSTEPVNFGSTPAGAEVYLNGIQMGTTPFKLQLKSNQTYFIEFRKDGYINRTVVLNSSLSPGYLILDILFGLIPVAVDAATGAWMSFDQNFVGVPLRPVTSEE